MSIFCALPTLTAQHYNLLSQNWLLTFRSRRKQHIKRWVQFLCRHEFLSSSHQPKHHKNPHHKITLYCDWVKEKRMHWGHRKRPYPRQKASKKRCGLQGKCYLKFVCQEKHKCCNRQGCINQQRDYKTLGRPRKNLDKSNQVIRALWRTRKEVDGEQIRRGSKMEKVPGIWSYCFRTLTACSRCGFLCWEGCSVTHMWKEKVIVI